jgi:cytochrome P450
MDTTSGALARTLFVFSLHQGAQSKLRQEIREAKKSGELSYDELVALPYLDAVCRETLRVYVYHPFHYCLC